MYQQQTPQQRAYAVSSYVLDSAKETYEISVGGDQAEITLVPHTTENVPTSFLKAWVRARAAFAVAPDEQIFHSLLEEWRKDSLVMSSTTEMVLLPSYQRIIGMGEKAIPFILRQLERERDQPENWFWALQHITGQDPVRVSDRGNRNAMAAAWLDWARFRYAW